MRPRRQTNPITIAFAKKTCVCLQIHCLACAYMEKVGFEGFGDQERVPDLPKRRNWRCPRCGSHLIETRPEYSVKDGKRSWYGLTPDGDM